MLNEALSFTMDWADQYFVHSALPGAQIPEYLYAADGNFS